MNDILKNMTDDYDIENLAHDAIKKLREASYSRGYKDGFNDGKRSEYERSLFVKEDTNERL